MEHQALNAQAAGEIVTGLEQEIAKVIVGQHTLVRRMLTALFAAIPFAVTQGRARSGCGPTPSTSRCNTAPTSSTKRRFSECSDTSRLCSRASRKTLSNTSRSCRC